MSVLQWNESGRTGVEAFSCDTVGILGIKGLSLCLENKLNNDRTLVHSPSHPCFRMLKLLRQEHQPGLWWKWIFNANRCSVPQITQEREPFAGELSGFGMHIYKSGKGERCGGWRNCLGWSEKGKNDYEQRCMKIPSLLLYLYAVDVGLFVSRFCPCWSWFVYFFHTIHMPFCTRAKQNQKWRV